MNDIKLFLRLQLKILWRTFRQMGAASFALLGIIAFVLFVLYKVEMPYASLGVCVVLLLLFQQGRSDIGFLKSLFPKYQRLLAVEYLLISFPFFVISALRMEWWQILVMMVCACIVPCVRKVSFKSSRPLPLPFMYHGGIEMLCHVRRIWWLLPLFFIGAIEGCVYDNINLVRVCVLLWIVCISFNSCNPQPLMMQFGGFRLFLKENLKMILLDITMLLLPIDIILLVATHDIVQFVNVWLIALLLSASITFVRYVCAQELLMFMFYILVWTIGLVSFMFIWCNVIFILIIVAILFKVHDKYEYQWN